MPTFFTQSKVIFTDYNQLIEFITQRLEPPTWAHLPPALQPTSDEDLYKLFLVSTNGHIYFLPDLLDPHNEEKGGNAEIFFKIVDKNEENIISADKLIGNIDYLSLPYCRGLARELNELKAEYHADKSCFENLSSVQKLKTQTEKPDLKQQIKKTAQQRRTIEKKIIARQRRFIHQHITTNLLTLTKNKIQSPISRDPIIISEITIYGNNYNYGELSQSRLFKTQQKDPVNSCPLTQEQIFLDEATFSLRLLGINETIKLANNAKDAKNKLSLGELDRFKTQLLNQKGIESNKHISLGSITHCLSAASHAKFFIQNKQREIDDLKNATEKLKQQAPSHKKKSYFYSALAGGVAILTIGLSLFLPPLLPAILIIAIGLTGLVGLAGFIFAARNQREKYSELTNTLHLNEESLASKEEELNQAKANQEKNQPRYDETYEKIKLLSEKNEKAIAVVDQAIHETYKRNQNRSVNPAVTSTSFSALPFTLLNNLGPAATTEVNVQRVNPSPRM